MKSVTRKEICDEFRRKTTFRALLDVRVHGFESDQECQVFDYFRLMTASRCCLFFGSDFWTGRVLQISHADTAIRHAVLALGALQLERESAGPLVGNKHGGFAFQSYNQAIAHTSRLLAKPGNDNFEKGLVACVLFICYESLLGHYAMAQMHLQNGLRILSEASREPPWSGRSYRREIPDDILHVFSRLDLQAMSLSESSSPYPFANSFRRIKQPEPVPLQFSSLTEAQYHLFEHTKWLFLLGEVLETTEPIKTQELLLSRLGCDDELARWLTVLDSFREKSRRDETWTHELQYTYNLLQVYHGITVAFCKPFSLDSELLFDQHYLHFNCMLDLLESITSATSSVQAGQRPLSKVLFSFELGVVLPLFIIGTKCRDPKLRRRAIAHLYSINRREGLWDSLGAARVAETIMMMEEEGLGDVQRADQIGNERRVHEMYARINVERREIELRCMMRRRTDGQYEARDFLVHF